MRPRRTLRLSLVAAALAAGASLASVAGATAHGGSAPRSSVSANVRISTCGGGNSEVEEATWHNDVYADWIGCGGIGFARSTDGGRHFSTAILLPGSANTDCTNSRCADTSWDPAIAVTSSGRLYTSFMHNAGTSRSPVVDASGNQGASFAQSVALPVPASSDPRGNWGDRDFLAVAPSGTVYVTWDYGPSYSQVTIDCAHGGSCSFASGDLNGVIQTSTNGGRTWTKVHPFTPDYPYGGVPGAPILVQGNGTIDVQYLCFPTSGADHTLHPGNEFFTRSTNGGATWSKPIRLWASVGTVSLTEWWIDGDLATDPAGDLYVTWDTQSSHDVAWLTFSTDGGSRWHAPVRVTSPNGTVEELVQPAGVGRGLVDVGWQTPGPHGYATYVRPYSVVKGWLRSAPLLVSSAYGSASIWPGDTFGLVAGPGPATSHGLPAEMAWGSATPATPNVSEIYAAVASP